MKNFKNYQAIWLLIFCMSNIAGSLSPPAQADQLADKNARGTSSQLIEKQWQLSYLASTTTGTISAYPGATLFLQQGKISGNGSCNHYAGSYQLQGQKLHINLSVLSMMACAEVERMVQEQRYFELLSQVVSYQLVAGNLQLLNAQGKPLLIFTVAK
jgi:heat shock protein HslJ